MSISNVVGSLDQSVCRGVVEGCKRVFKPFWAISTVFVCLAMLLMFTIKIRLSITTHTIDRSRGASDVCLPLDPRKILAK